MSPQNELREGKLRDLRNFSCDFSTLFLTFAGKVKNNWLCICIYLQDNLKQWQTNPKNYSNQLMRNFFSHFRERISEVMIPLLCFTLSWAVPILDVYGQTTKSLRGFFLSLVNFVNFTTQMIKFFAFYPQKNFSNHETCHFIRPQ